MFIVTLHKVVNNSGFCVFDKKHTVSIAFVTNQYKAAFNAAQQIADKYDATRTDSQGAAVTRWSTGGYMPDVEIAILKVTENKLTSVLATPIIHDSYVE